MYHLFVPTYITYVLSSNALRLTAYSEVSIQQINLNAENIQIKNLL
jgi:hypothetical protein